MRVVTFKQVEAFYWAAKLGSFEAAAVKLNLAQSTVSKRIQEFEAFSKDVLFDRTGRNATLTLKGREVLHASEAILDARAGIVSLLDTKEIYTGVLRLGVTEIVAMTWLPKFLEAISTSYPQMVVDFDVDTSTSLADKLARNHIDIAIATIYGDSPGITIVELGTIRYNLVCSPKLSGGSRQVELSKIEALPLLAQNDTLGMPSPLVQFLKKNGLRFNRVATCNSLSARVRLAEAGFGLTCLPRDYFASDIECGRLVVVDSDPPIPDFQYGAFYRNEDRVGLVPRIAAMAREVCDFAIAREH